MQTWKPENGAFSTWYTIQLRAVFVEAYGMRTKRTREDPLNKYHLSLDTPLDENEDGSFTIADVLPDEAAEEAFEDVEQRDFQQAVQAALAQITWYHHIALMDKVKNADEHIWYAEQVAKNGWSSPAAPAYPQTADGVLLIKNTETSDKAEPERGLFKL